MKTLEQLLKNYGLSIREAIDLTEKTSEPGNTMLTLFFLEPDDEDNDDIYTSKFHDYLALDIETNLYDSSGDHHQEVKIISQNTELVVILNENK